MAKVCQLCGKKISVGHNVSKAHNLTKRRFSPNLHTITVIINKKVKKIKLCTRCIRSAKLQKAVKIPKTVAAAE